MRAGFRPSAGVQQARVDVARLDVQQTLADRDQLAPAAAGFQNAREQSQGFGAVRIQRERFADIPLGLLEQLIRARFSGGKCRGCYGGWPARLLVQFRQPKRERFRPAGVFRIGQVEPGQMPSIGVAHHGQDRLAVGSAVVAARDAEVFQPQTSPLQQCGKLRLIPFARVTGIGRRAGVVAAPGQIPLGSGDDGHERVTQQRLQVVQERFGVDQMLDHVGTNHHGIRGVADGNGPGRRLFQIRLEPASPRMVTAAVVEVVAEIDADGFKLILQRHEFLGVPAADIDQPPGAEPAGHRRRVRVNVRLPDDLVGVGDRVVEILRLRARFITGLEAVRDRRRRGRPNAGLAGEGHGFAPAFQYDLARAVTG